MNKSAQPDEDADWSQATPGVRAHTVIFQRIV